MRSSDMRKLANLLSGSLQVNIVPGPGWAYNHKKREVYYKASEATILDSDSVTSLLLHESGHIKYTTPWDKIDLSKIEDDHRNMLQKLLLNAIEDFRIEDQIRANYPFASDFLPEYSFQALYLLEEHWNQINFERFQAQKNPDKKVRQKWEKRFKYIQYCFGIYSRIGGYSLIPVEEDVLKVIDQTAKAAKAARKGESTQKLVDIVAKEIYPKIKQWLVMDYSDEAQHGMRVKVPSVKGGHLSSESTRRDVTEIVDEVDHLIGPTYRKLNKVLTLNVQRGFEGKYRSGPVLNNPKLYRHRLDDFRLFQRKFEKSYRDYVFSLLVDLSGSMGGEKIQQALATVVLFNKVLAKLDLPHSIWGFNEKVDQYKNIDNKVLQENIYDRMLKIFSMHGGSNNDGWAVHDAAVSLKKYPAQQKVMFVISDGQPAPSVPQYHDLSYEVSLAEKENIFVLGIGIGSDQQVKRFYKNFVEVADLNLLPQIVADQLKRRFKAKY